MLSIPVFGRRGKYVHEVLAYLNHTNKCDFLKRRYLYSDFVCARSTGHFKWHNLQSLVKALGVFYRIKSL